MTKVTSEQLSRSRGCILGLLLGDAVGATGGVIPDAGPLRVTCAGQLACFTVEGIIRANVRGAHKGICHPPSVLWNAYRRWAILQGIPGIASGGGDEPPDGWLAQTQVLSVRRGSAPATVSALQQGRMGTLEKPAGSSIGAHALTRTLPAGLIRWWGNDQSEFAAEAAATTHAREAAEAAGIGATVIARLAQGEELDAALSGVDAAVAAVRSHPRQATVLAGLASRATAADSLAGGAFVALSFPVPDQIRDALRFAAEAGNGRHVAAVAGAFLGTRHGMDALPVGWLSRMELAWVGDTLARDLMAEFVDGPSGSGYAPAPDPHWWARYPGW